MYRYLSMLIASLSLVSFTPIALAADQGVIIQRIAATAKALQDAKTCDFTKGPDSCKTPVSSFTDFAIYFRFCPQFKNYQFTYTTKGNFLFTISATQAGVCQLTIVTDTGQRKTCMLTSNDVNQVSSMNSLLMLDQYDAGKVTGQQVTSYIKPIINCIPEAQPPAQPEQIQLNPGTNTQ